MTLGLPAAIKTDAFGFRCIVDRYHAAKNGGEHRVGFDCSICRWIDANLCAALGVVVSSLRRSGLEVEAEGSVDNGLHAVVLENKFLQNSLWGKNDCCSDSPDEFAGRVNLPYCRYDFGESKKFIREYARKLISTNWMPKMTIGVRAKIIESLGELFDNAKTHSESVSGVHVCGQYIPTSQKLLFSMADGGIGFRERLLRNEVEFSGTALEAIQWSIDPLHTAKRTEAPGGLGLKILREFIDMNCGRLLIVSDAGYWELSHGRTNGFLLGHPFPGTVISIEVNAADKQSYRLKNEAVS